MRPNTLPYLFNDFYQRQITKILTLCQNKITICQEKNAKDCIFQKDYDPKHKAKLVQEFLKVRKVKVLDHPAQSPDLNPIANLWDALGIRVATKKHSNKVAVWHNLQEEWEKIRKDNVQRLVDSMPRRRAAVIAAKGMATKYQSLKNKIMNFFLTL